MPIRNHTSVSNAVLDEPDLLDREQDLLYLIGSKTSFAPTKRLGDSRFWSRSYAGAVFYRGTYQNQPAVLKIQGTKPPVSEIDQIQNFTKSNQSQLIRPPQLYHFIRWQEKQRFEALILEDVQGTPIISFPTNHDQLTLFFQLYRDYRQNCRQHPWLPQPKKTLPQIIQNDFDNWHHISQKLFPHHPLRQKEDAQLIKQAIDTLINQYRSIKPEFLHGHFAYHDLLQQSNEYILFSNLFWKFKAPYYDTVFAHHWFMLALSSKPNITPHLIDSQYQLWLQHIRPFANTQREKRLLNLALLERAAAALNLDALTLDPNHPNTSHIINSTRQEIHRLIQVLYC